MAKVKNPKSESATSLFDYINWLTIKKRNWEDLTPQEKKGFNVFIVNRFLSMELAFCEAINEMQEYTTSMDKGLVWRIYSQILPKQKLYLNYIKPNPIEGVDERDIKIFIKHFNCKESQAIEYLKLLNSKGLESEIKILKSNYMYE